MGPVPQEELGDTHKLVVPEAGTAPAGFGSSHFSRVNSSPGTVWTPHDLTAFSRETGTEAGVWRRAGGWTSRSGTGLLGPES